MSIELTPVPVVKPEQVEIMRQIRNECALFMTKHRDQISRDEQLAWWARLDPYETFCLLYADGTDYAGYGLILTRQGKSWVTGGLMPEYRDKKLGRQVFGWLIRYSRCPVWLEVRADNPRAKKLYQNLGFEEVSTTGEVDTMYLPVAGTPQCTR